MMHLILSLLLYITSAKIGKRRRRRKEKEKEKEKKKKQIGMNHTREGIGRCRQPAGQVEGEQ
jgi:hypothetical protein